jgi:hypothetical protein
MSAHWAHGTITKWFTAPILSAAALLASCDEATGPAPTALRPGGVIQADAQAGTVSAKGNGQVAQTIECDPTMTFCPSSGGKGAMFSFDFSGPAPTANTFTDASGTFSVKFRETGDVVQYDGVATIYPGEHRLLVDGDCKVTTADGMTSITTVCSLDAQDQGEPGSGDAFTLFFVGPASSGIASAPVISGGMQID